MKPFFNKGQTASDIITKIPLTCASCGLFKKARNGRAKPWGKFGKKILIIGEAPSKKDDRAKKAWSDSNGDYLKWVFKKNGIHLFRDALTSYASICPIPKDAKPDEKEIGCCRKHIIKLIRKLKPKMIFLVGAAAVRSVIGKSWKKGLGGMERWRGFTIPDREHKAWICPIFSPKYVSRREDRRGRNLAEVIWLQDVKRAMLKYDKPIVFEDETKYITYIESDKHFKSIMPRLLAADLASFDYEGTGLKPHAKGHQITNTACCIGLKECYSWENNRYRDMLFKQFLESRVKKSAHNLAFENMWSLVILKAVVRGWYWDSMINAHILDNRKTISGLKFQTFVNFGVVDYDSHISPFLQSGDENGANSFNTILKFIKQYGIQQLLTYCGLDAIYGYYLTLLQIQIIKEQSR